MADAILAILLLALGLAGLALAMAASAGDPLGRSPWQLSPRLLTGGVVLTVAGAAYLARLVLA